MGIKLNVNVGKIKRSIKTRVTFTEVLGQQIAQSTLYKNNSGRSIARISRESRGGASACQDLRDYSPTTLYRDYPISPTRFHWESQGIVHDGTKTGLRYMNHVAGGTDVWLFVRRTRSARPDITAPYTFVGPSTYVRHQGGRPMAIEWKLARPMPSWLYQETKLAAG